MDTLGLLQFLRQYRLAVQATVSAAASPQAAVIGYAITDRFEIVFDTLGRLSWPGLIYVRVRPRWIRYSDYTVNPPRIVEFLPEQLVI